MRHLVTVIADTPWAEHLVLHGSVTMSAWFGAAAREPGDVDFVVTPVSRARIMYDVGTVSLLAALVALQYWPS